LCFRSIQSEQQTIIRERWIIDAIPIHNHGIDQAAQFKQAVPLAPIACQARGFQAEHSSDFPTADFRDQMIKSRTLDQAATRAAQIIVNDLHLGKPQLSRSLHQAVLQALALSVMKDLAG
jgi:hypothetical protein